MAPRPGTSPTLRVAVSGVGVRAAVFGGVGRSGLWMGQEACQRIVRW